MEKDTNAYGVPSRVYAIQFEDGEWREVDVAEEDDWGNIQRFTRPFGKERRVNAIGFGGDAEGFKAVVRAEDVESGEEWDTPEKVYEWWRDKISVYADHYGRG